MTENKNVSSLKFPSSPSAIGRTYIAHFPAGSFNFDVCSPSIFAVSMIPAY